MSAISWLSLIAIAVTSTISLIELLKERKEKRGKRWRRNLLLSLTLMGLTVGVSLIVREDRSRVAGDQLHATERNEDKQRIAGLTQSVEAQIRNNETQYLRNRDEIHKLQDQLTDIKKQVATEELRRQMEALQLRLDKALTPSPQAKLQSSFWTDPIQDDIVTDIYAPLDGNVVQFSFTLTNHSGVNAKGGQLWLRVCLKCKIQKQPDGFQQVPGAPDFERLYKFGDLPSGARLQKMTAEVEVPSGFSGKMIFATKYRCDNCEIEKDWQQLGVTLGRISLPRSLQPAQQKKGPSQTAKPKKVPKPN